MLNDFDLLVKQSRSYRRFVENKRIPGEEIVRLVDIARFCPSARNRQPLRYIISDDPVITQKIRTCLLWALDLPEWGGPVAGELPVAYITILSGKNCVPDPAIDVGIAAQTIRLAAASTGIGGCMFGSIKKDELRELLSISEKYNIQMVIALGYPAETVVAEELKPNADTNYWRDDQDVHHVPKRTLDEVLMVKGPGGK